MVVVIDYNVGNVRSVCNAFDYIGCPARLTRDEQAIREAWGLVLPGVAAFGYAVGALGPTARLVKEMAQAGKPLLGICVGYQMLFDYSTEHGRHEGLGLIAGSVGPIPPGRVIPHMGWNLVEWPAGMDLFAGLGRAKHFYFAHSYCATIDDPQATVAQADYGFELAASVQKARIYGTQFHPEKSGRQGLHLLRNFYRICARDAGRTDREDPSC